MQILVAVLAASLAFGFMPEAIAAAGDDPAKAKDSSPRQTLTGPVEELSRAQQLDALFETLKAAKDEEAANAAENSIAALWLDSGSATVDLLMEWTLAAVKEKNYPLALDYLDRILTLKPDYVEGWNTRATVYFMTEDLGRALADIERVLAIEPRHFGALSGLGTILREIGDEKRALEVYRRAIAVDPHLPNVKKAIDDLEGKGAGGREI
jgi:tetratricopeptide (TPR) repeat protein